jgi:hypothetical protein
MNARSAVPAEALTHDPSNEAKLSGKDSFEIANEALGKLRFSTPKKYGEGLAPWRRLPSLFVSEG